MENSRLSDKVRAFEDTVKRVVPATKEPGFTPAGWAPLAELVAVDEFERVGTWLEVMNWREYTDFLTKWASATEFETTLRRISEVRNLVYLEVQERHRMGEGTPIEVNSLSVFEFNDDGKVRHLDVYLQRPMEQ